MDQFKQLVISHEQSNERDSEHKKDKLAETKRVERETKERLKNEQRLAKEKKREAARLDAAKHREERALSCSQTKRATREAREATKKEAQKSGEMCDHGIWKCQICSPSPRTGKVNHHKDALMTLQSL